MGEDVADEREGDGYTASLIQERIPTIDTLLRRERKLARDLMMMAWNVMLYYYCC